MVFISTVGPTLNFIPLLKLKAKKHCKILLDNEEPIKQFKRLVLDNLEIRLPESNSRKVMQIVNLITRDLVSKDIALATL